ncbi:ArsR/SmtB family transcription factor [Nocardia asteroides]|uniref:ArsR/SmtB family transcription factor n=1 Tax=Nocardia asteroides TaxID=1824 RepID=UPI001E32460D|nr:metalloregulator ArsR/SmtB family transcription factor [Nocardia asteroides]UGT62186.1 metalloregulator ArsR/SmtB family transcription factor [Nocardia asteroides]
MSNSTVPGPRTPAGCDPAPLTRAPLSEKAAAEAVVVFKALADPVRLRLLSAIAARENQEACVCEVSAGLELAQPTISHHLKVLRSAGLLTSQRRASWVYYRLVPHALTGLAALLLAEAGHPHEAGVPA